MMNLKMSMAKKAKRRKEAEVRQGRLKKEHGLMDQEVVIVEKSHILKFLIRVLADAVRTIAAVIIAGLAFLGIAALVYPGPRRELFLIWLDILRQLQSYI